MPSKEAVAAQKSSVAKVPTQTHDAVQLKRIMSGLTRMGDKRPERLTSFLRHIESMLGKDTPPAAVQQTVERLRSAGTIQISDDKVVYT